MLAPPAQAGDFGCPGSLIESIPVVTNDSGFRYGTLLVYYSSANGGTNCAVTYRSPGFSGKSNMEAAVGRCRDSSTVPLCSTDKSDVDNGTYGTYAGPVSVTQTAGHCIVASGWIEEPRTGTDGYADLTRSHCG